MADVEKGEKALLLDKDPLVAELGATPVGGHPGNDNFYVVLQLAARGTVFAMLLASIVWIPGVLDRFAAYIPLAVCIFVFTLNPYFGTVVNNAHAGIIGTFLACFNIFMMRGFFPDGVEPTDGRFSTVNVAGWANFLLFDLLFLITDCRMGTRMFALANHTGFMLAFLNPADQTVYSKNFKINPNGVAVSSFLGVSLGSVAAVIAMLVPFPWGMGFRQMKANAVSGAQDTARLFIAAVKYFSGDHATVLIEQQLAQTGLLRAKLDAMGGPIGAAWDECFDIGNSGTVRALMTAQLGMLNNIFDSLHSLTVAMSTEDFGPSHKKCMADICEASMDVVVSASRLLIKASEAAGDGSIDNNEKAELNDLKETCLAKVSALASAFDATRRKFGKAVSAELLSESFFVFALSAYARKVIEFSDTLCNNPPKGTGFGAAFMAGVKATFVPSNPYWGRFTLRYFAGLTLCMIFSVTMDNYGGACAITAVFLLTTKVGPDMMSVLNVLLAVVVGAVVGAVLFSYSCMTGTGNAVLIVVTAIYMFITMFVSYGGSSFALIGIFMAALSPFAMMKNCPGEEVDDDAAAAGLWVGIRGCIIAMVIMAACEFASIPGEQAKLARDGWNLAMEQIKIAFADLWDETHPGEALAPVPGYLGGSGTFNNGAKLEPRFDRCKWKDAYLTELIDYATKLRLDILAIRAGLEGNDGDTGETMRKLNLIPAFGAIKQDLAHTLEDAREIAMMLLCHEKDDFHGLDKLDTLVGIDSLDALPTAIEQANTIVKFPATCPSTMEEDELCQISIVFVMLDYTVKHIAAIIKSTVEKQV